MSQNTTPATQERIDTITINGREYLAKDSIPTPEPTIVTVDSPYDLLLNKPVFLRTASMIDVGVLVAVTEKELVLKDAAWVADTGRFTQALATGNFSEVEMFPKGTVIVGRAWVVDACALPSLPTKQK